MNGADVLLYVNTGSDAQPTWTAVGSQRNASIQETTDAVDYSSKDGRAARVFGGRYASSISLDALYVPTDSAYGALKTAFRNGDLIQVRVSENQVDTEQASAVITDMSREYPDQAAATISVSLTVDGEWTEVDAS